MVLWEVFLDEFDKCLADVSFDILAIYNIYILVFLFFFFFFFFALDGYSDQTDLLNVSARRLFKRIE